MAFKDNWPLHLTAALTGDGLDHKLAQDFWSEELFNYKSMVRYHWLKIIWVYFASSLSQITLPTSIILIPVTIYENGGSDWTWAVIPIGLATVMSWVIVVIAATARWVDLKRKAKKELESG